jgi:SAM-dependent methyltransferase
MATYYTSAFAAFYERYLTGWIQHFAPRLVGYMNHTQTAERSILDLCCGTGESASIFCKAHWRVTGLDLSSGMLGVAREKLRAMEEAGQVSLFQANATDFVLPSKVGACIALDGALNHLDSYDDLVRCFSSVNAALLDGGQFVFDLFEPAHFRHWHRITLFDEADAVVAKRGVWDENSGRGMLRYSGVFGTDNACSRLEQTLQSVAFTSDEVNEALAATGFTRVECDLESNSTGMRPDALNPESSPRTIYRAIKMQ